MNAFDLLFGPIGPALEFVFTIGYIPNQNDFLELTEQQYIAYVKLVVQSCTDQRFINMQA